MDKNGCQYHEQTPSIDTTASSSQSGQPQKPSILPTSYLSMENVQGTPSSSSPVISTCNVLPSVAWSLNTAVAEQPILDCSMPYSQNCERIHCNVLGSNDTIVLLVQSCTSPPSFSLIARNGTGVVIFNQTISESTQVNMQLTNGYVPVYFTVIQHSNLLTLGLSVSPPNVVV